MTTELYLQCFAIAVIGMAIQTAMKMKSLQDKARAANVTFKVRQYFSNDWLSITISLLTILLFILIVDNLLNWKPVIIDYVKIGFAFIGYTGSDIASRLFGVVNRKINNVIDAKTNIADNVTESPKTPLT